MFIVKPAPYEKLYDVVIQSEDCNEVSPQLTGEKLAKIDKRPVQKLVLQIPVHLKKKKGWVLIQAVYESVHSGYKVRRLFAIV